MSLMHSFMQHQYFFGISCMFLMLKLLNMWLSEQKPAIFAYKLKFIICDQTCENTVNEERFAGLNFRGFHGFQEYCESFSVNISASL